jgi:ACT domain-containing protein
LRVHVGVFLLQPLDKVNGRVLVIRHTKQELKLPGKQSQVYVSTENVRETERERGEIVNQMFAILYK